MEIIRPASIVEVIPSDEPVVWRDVDTPDPFGVAYRSDPVTIVQENLDYPVRPISRFEDGDYYRRTPSHRYSKYRAGSSRYRRPTSGYDDSYYDYSRGPREYSSRAYDYRGSSSRLDYDYYGRNPTVVSRDGYVRPVEFSQRPDYFSDGYVNPSEYVGQREYDEGYLSSGYSRHDHYRPYRSYDAFRYR